MESIRVPGTGGDAGLPDGGMGVRENEVGFAGAGVTVGLQHGGKFPVVVGEYTGMAIVAAKMVKTTKEMLKNFILSQLRWRVFVSKLLSQLDLSLL